MDVLEQMLNRLSYHLAGAHRRAFYSTLRKCLERDSVHKNEEYFARIKVMEMYCLAADGLVTKAQRIFEESVRERRALAEAHEIEKIMVRKTLLLTNMLEEIDPTDLSDTEKFELYLIGQKYDLCKKYAISLIKEHGKYAMSLILAQSDFTGRNLSSLSLLLERLAVTNSLISFLLRKNVPYLVVKKHIKPKKDASFLLLMKEVLLAGENIEEFGYPTVFSLINDLDDWDLYEYAIANSIPIEQAQMESPKKKDTIHSIKYAMITNPTPGAVSAYINKIGRIDSASCKYIERFSITEKGCLFSDLSPACQRMFELYGGAQPQPEDLAIHNENEKKEYKRDKMTVLVLETLLRKRTDESLADALLLSYACREHSAYIRVILCALFRYFLMYTHLIQEFNGLGVENVQIEGMAYLWSDLEVLLGIDAGAHTEAYLQTRSRAIAEINNKVMDFVDSEAYSQIEPLLAYKKALVESPVYKQIEERRLHTSDRRPSIEKVVVEDVRYIFDKITKIPGEKECTLVTIHQRPKELSIERVKELINGSITRVKQYAPFSKIDKLACEIILAQEAGHSAISSQAV